jgi:hypothetical protein
LDQSGGGILTHEAWRKAGDALARRRWQMATTGSQQMWEVGDWLVTGEDAVFARLKRTKVRELAADISGYSRHTLTMAVSVARKVPPSVRVDGLSWWHHLAVAKLGSTEQAEWLERAAEQEWTVQTLRDHLRPPLAPRRSRSRRLVGQLTKLTIDDIPEAAIAELRAWVQRELGD